MIPLALVIFGIGDLSKIVVIIFPVSLIIAINTIYGVKSVKNIRKELFNSLKASKFQIFTKLILPESLPYIMSGLRTAISHGLGLVVVTEMLTGTRYGIGYSILTQQLLYNIPEMYSYIIVLGIIGFILNAIIVRIERRFIFWTGK